MAVISNLTEEEAALVSILTDASGSELAEFMYEDQEAEHGRYRLWPFQWTYHHSDMKYQADAMGRGLGKSVSATLRLNAFVFNFPGAESLITAPEGSHLSLLTDKVEAALLKYRLLKEMLPGAGRNERTNGIRKAPHWQVTFANGARILSRLPQRDGKGVKGCLARDTLVLTQNGHVPVQDVAVGDMVLTHEGRWRPVTATHKYAVDHAYEIAGAGHRGMVVSDQHRFYARFNTSSPKQVRNLLEPQWVDADDPEIGRFYWATPTYVPAFGAPVWPEGFDAAGEPPWVLEDLLRFAGHYVADGHLGKDSSARGYVYSGHSGAITRVVITDSTDMARLVQRVARSFGASSATKPHPDHPATTSHLEVYDRSLGRWLYEQFGELSDGKRLPGWLLGASEDLRRAFWEGYAAGDGHYDAKRDRTVVSTASRRLAADVRTLAASLGYSTGLSWVDPKVTHVGGVKLKVAPKRSYRVEVRGRSTQVREGGCDWGKIRSAKKVPCDFVYDITVADDHSYVAEGVVHHNTHPLQIELDELQDFPRKGFTELIETIKISEPGAIFRCHGVSNGVGDIHHQITSGKNPDLPFYVHRYIASHRPTWNDEERKAKIAMYGGTEDHPDYVRNIFGEPGSAHNPVFVLARLMACVRVEESSWATEYNHDVYHNLKLDDESRARANAPIVDQLKLPMGHLSEEYSSYWAGMDVGFTSDPSEILVFGVVKRRGKEDLMRLLTRISLVRISAPHQVEVITAIFDHYGKRLRRFGLDKTGNGLPLFQTLKDVPGVGSRLAGYGFSEKKPVELDDRELAKGEKPEDLVIVKRVVDHATDVLRKWVDTGSLELPYDTELLGQWQGQSIRSSSRSGEQMVRQYVGGADHTLDAARMFAAAKDLQTIEALLEKPKVAPPVLDLFF